MINDTNEEILILAAEDCDPFSFAEIHRFSKFDERIIRKLVVHGPVLLQGGRGSGKSALMVAAAGRMWPKERDSSAFGLYVSLRNMPLLDSQGRDYEKIFCELLIRTISETLAGCGSNVEFQGGSEIGALQYAIARLSEDLGKRVVLLFDDAAHIGREAPLAEFFDIFRTLCSSTVSCKAAIYPGVTRFGTRFDVYNDASVVEIARSEDQPLFREFFADVVRARFPDLENMEFISPLTLEDVAGFLGQCVVGNMRGFVIACTKLREIAEGQSVGVNLLSDTLKVLNSDHFWPLFEEVSPKLGKYQSAAKSAEQLANMLLKEAGGKGGRPSVLVHRDHIARLSKPFEILEYVGFIAKREASRAMKSGGRGRRYMLNLCTLLEHVPANRLTAGLYEQWTRGNGDPVEFHARGTQLSSVDEPVVAPDDVELSILSAPVSILSKSNVYPYGLSPKKIDALELEGICTVRQLAEASDEKLQDIHSVGPATIVRFRNVVGQAVWM